MRLLVVEDNRSLLANLFDYFEARGHTLDAAPGRPHAQPMSDHDVTRFLEAAERGDPVAANELLPLVYDELRRLAALKLRGEAPGHTLQATALVHEAYLRLGGAAFEERSKFLRTAALAMQRILVDHARRKRAAKRGERRPKR